MKRFAIAALPLLLANCAAITTGTSQTVSVSTDPAGAVCRLDRGGETVGIINPTPGSVNLSKSKDHVTVFCQKEGFEDNTGPLASSFQGMTFGNILFGGLVGLTIDAASGAMHEYPSSVTIVLTPTEFTTVAERDAFYARARANLQSAAAAAIEKAKSECGGSDTSSCDARVKELTQQRDADVAALEAKRQAARVRSV